MQVQGACEISSSLNFSSGPGRMRSSPVAPKAFRGAPVRRLPDRHSVRIFHGAARNAG